MVVSVCDKRTCPCFEEGAQPIEQSLLTKFEEILPATHNHVVCRCRGNEDQFDAVFHTNIFEESQAVMWLKSFEDSTKTTWRSFKTYPEVGSKVLFKKDYCCQHNTRPRSSTADTRRGSKNTGCCARIKITVNNTSFAHKEKKVRLSRSKDPHRLENPTQIVVKFEHNHPLNGASALKHRDVSEDAKAKIDHLLLDGYAPSAALEKFKFDLQLDDPDNYVTNSGDRAICPDLSWVYRRSYHLGTKKNGNKDCPNDIKEFVDSLNLQFLMDSASLSPAAECRSILALPMGPENWGTAPREETHLLPRKGNPLRFRQGGDGKAL
ncbi:hypothetical protein GJAV_G00158190 [Gymnothorax javanicus]|nr:hypothetical protein GJAV_G00158190 [Gymnothorax javanicus]